MIGMFEGMTEVTAEAMNERRAKEELLSNEAIAAFLAAPSQEAADAFMLRFSESQQRPHDLLLFLPHVHPNPFSLDAWKWIAVEWPGFDRIPHARYQRVFRYRKLGWSPDCMCPESRAVYDALPNTFTAYRGQDAASPIGLSWTLERDVAAGFARGHRGLNNPNPVILRRKFRKISVAMILVDRQEHEVVLFKPPHDLSVDRLPLEAG